MRHSCPFNHYWFKVRFISISVIIILKIWAEHYKAPFFVSFKYLFQGIRSWKIIYCTFFCLKWKFIMFFSIYICNVLWKSHFYILFSFIIQMKRLMAIPDFLYNWSKHKLCILERMFHIMLIFFKKHFFTCQITWFLNHFKEIQISIPVE